ncbi:MAG: pyridoxal phosphate-dependent aminotransferase [Muribaculaceae bacterium]|nr:pyridoxal phosphate-dependent aminotransferase [Muribaculaceae bacterium]
MKFNFDELTERRGTASVKWDSDSDSDILPLWVADMDFRTAPAVTEALLRRVRSGIFGYVNVPDSYYEALTRWFETRHGWYIPRERVIYTSGVVPAISAIIKALVKPGEGVIIQTPAYNCFFSSVRNNKAVMVENKLKRVERGDGFTYEIDFEDLERCAAMPTTKMLLLCNPQNPTGRVWRREELERVRDICARHGVRVVSDEIHCEVVHKGYKFIPYATVDSSAVICCSPSKAFNTAGLQIANIVSPDGGTQALIDRAINDNEVCDVNPFGVVGLIAAYNEGGEWLDDLNRYLDANYEYLRERFRREFPELKVCDSEATYLSWIDIRPLGIGSEALEEKLKETVKVHINGGLMYGDDGYIRINYACPRLRLEEAMNRLIRGLLQLEINSTDNKSY